MRRYKWLLIFTGNKFKPAVYKTKFIFWANDTETLLEQLVRQPEAEEYNIVIEKIYQTIKKYRLAFNKLS